MTSNRIRKSAIIVVALSGAAINIVYSIDLLAAFFDPQYNNFIKDIMISAVVLEIGWISLLVWVIFNPFERRHILLFTIVPILLGNILHSVNQFGAYSENASAFLLNTTFGLFYSGLYIAAFVAGKEGKTIRS